MFNQELYASAFARAVELMRARPASKEQQKAALRALVALAELSAASLRLYEGVLSVDDVAIADTAPHLPALVQRMQVHRVAELMIGRQTEPAELLALLRGLAAGPDEGGTIKERLRDAGSTRIMVILEQAAAPGRRAASVTQAFEAADIEEAAVEEFRATEEPELGGGREIVLDFGDEAPAAPAPAEAAPADAEPALPVAADTPLGAALASVVLNPYGHGLLDRLTELSEHLQAALREDQAEAALRALAIVIDLEPGAAEGTPRNSYGIVLKRTLTREALAQIAPCLLNPGLMDAAAKAVRRAKGDGVEVVLGLLATAEGMRERKAYMAVLRTIPEGRDRVLGMLDHHQWFVVRNVTELVGELRLEEAVPELGRLLTHREQRVRRAAAVALAKIGSVSTVEPLRRQLKDGAPEVRSLIASSIGGPHARALAMPLVALCETEENADVLREYYRALGRIGTGEAVQALAKSAAPGGKLIGRKNAAQRLAAVDGLRLAGAAAAGALESLAEDSDRAVRDAAQKAMKGAR